MWTRSVAQAAEDELVEQIYAAAMDASRWPSLMEAVADAIGASAGVMTRLDHVNALGESIPFRVDQAMLSAYEQYYHSKNVFTLVDDLGAWRRGWRPLVVSTADHLPVEDYYRSEYFNDFMRPQDVGPTLHIRLELDETTSSAIAFGRRLGRGEFSAEGWEVAARLQPHLIRAFKLGRQVSGALSAGSELALALDKSPHALFVVDATGVVRMANRPAEQLLAAARGLTVLNGRLLASHTDVANQLLKLLAQATAADGLRTGGAMSVPAPGERYPLAVRVAPLPVRHLPIFGQPRNALVCVTDLEAGVRSPEDELRALFGLTQAEARVATAIFEGLSMREASDLLGVALNTVRFQLARVYEKTGVTRQAELVKMMMRLSSSAGEGPLP